MTFSSLGTRDHASGARDHESGPRDHAAWARDYALHAVIFGLWQAFPGVLGPFRLVSAVRFV